ncbi:MAG: PIG-L family deacetylase, partial [Planctomycetes bacterium]|nr:PIG-L family deacetylase [Planctomycetota bacterium]
ETLRAAAMSGVEVRWLGMEDFGFSKSLEETRAKWGDAKLLDAMRRIVDEVDPDFVLTNHTLTQGHGHHRATFWAISEVLKERAARGGYVPTLLARSKVEEANWIVDPAELEPARGETYARLAHRAWTQHVTQGPWGAHNPLQVGRDWWRIVNADDCSKIVPPGSGEALPMPWAWVRSGDPDTGMAPVTMELPRADLIRAAREILQHDLGPEGDVRRTFGIDFRRRVAAQQILMSLANVRVEAWLERDEVATGSDGKINVVVHGAERVKDIQVRCGDRKGEPVTAPVRALVFDGLPVSPAMTLPPTALPAAPNAPTSPGPAGRFAVAFACEPPTGSPEPRFARVAVTLSLDGKTLTIERALPYTPVPPLALEWDREVVMVPKGKTVERVFSVAIDSHGDREITAPVRLSLPPGVQAVPVPSRIALSAEHPQSRVLVRATIAVDELPADAGIEIGLGDVAARIPLRPIDVAVPPGLRVALVRGPDDTTERALADLGVAFTALDRDALAMARLEDFTTLLLDIRAYHHRPELAEVRERILQFCRQGGRVVAMYHKPGEWNERKGHPLLAPFPLTIGDERATEENAPVVLLQPQHRLLQQPHAITADDFAGWVQERGLNFPKTQDPAWTPLLETKDAADEKPHQGSLLHTQYGRGDFVYCSLALYRQLRVGNAGAARLLVNLLAK